MLNTFGYICVFLVCLVPISESLPYQLNITFWQNKPYIFLKNGKPFGKIVQLFNSFQPKECGPDGLIFNYNTEMQTIAELAKSLKFNDTITHDSNRTMLGFLPFLPFTGNLHEVYFKYHLRNIMNSPGHTLVTNAVAQTKLYRLLFFGFADSVSLLFLMIFGSLSFGAIVWFLERRSDDKETDFTYHFVPGVWDGIWWAAVTLTTVGYGDKAPRTVAGKIVSLSWLMYSCVTLVSFGAIMTSSLTSENVSIAGLKVAYLQPTIGAQVIEANAGIPVATKTPEEALQMAEEMTVYGALLDTNYITVQQKELYDERKLLVDQRFHTVSNDIRIWLRKKAENETYKCFDEFMTYLKDMETSLKHLQPPLKANKKLNIGERLSPANSMGKGPLVLYCVTTAVAFLWLVVGLTDFIRERRKSKNRGKIVNTGPSTAKDALMLHIRERIESLDSQIGEIKSSFKELEGVLADSSQDCGKRDANCHTYPGYVNNKVGDGKQKEHTF